MTGAVLGFAHTVGEFGVVLMIGGNIPGKTKVLSVAIFDYVETMQWAQAQYPSWRDGGVCIRRHSLNDDDREKDCSARIMNYRPSAPGLVERSARLASMWRSRRRCAGSLRYSEGRVGQDGDIALHCGPQPSPGKPHSGRRGMARRGDGQVLRPMSDQ